MVVFAINQIQQLECIRVDKSFFFAKRYGNVMSLLMEQAEKSAL